MLYFLPFPEKKKKATDFADLIVACKSGDLDTVTKLLKKADLALNHFHVFFISIFYFQRKNQFSLSPFYTQEV